ncbi:MAG: hypothetical protein HOP30_07125 [Cyclobacteriaceae bacterium]|nr:hypothetical protein [Cyclobacteriaceae bacterium]
MLESVYSDLVSTYSQNIDLNQKLWVELKRTYQSKGRHYHTLEHLENLYAHLLEMKPHIQNWHAILFTLFYHDFVYGIHSSDNEEKSAFSAFDRMTQLTVPKRLIEITRSQILATKAHELSPDEDTNYFTDADLSVLGQDRKTYSLYSQDVRKEYSFYPNLIYNPGRKRVLRHFLTMPRIYKTEFAFQRWENNARINLQWELDSLAGIG